MCKQDHELIITQADLIDHLTTENEHLRAILAGRTDVAAITLAAAPDPVNPKHPLTMTVSIAGRKPATFRYNQESEATANKLVTLWLERQGVKEVVYI